jgi:hypothetical protein
VGGAGGSILSQMTTRQEISRKNNQINELKDDCDEFESKYRNVTDRLNEAEEQLEEKTTQITQKNKEIADQTNEIEALQQELDDIPTNTDLQNEINDLEEYVAELIDERDYYENLSNEYEEQLSSCDSREEDGPDILFVTTASSYSGIGNYNEKTTFTSSTSNIYVVSDVVNIRHLDLGRIGYTISVVSGGDLQYDYTGSDSRTFSGSQKGVEIYHRFSINNFEEGIFTVIFTVTDFITGLTSSKLTTFEIT